MNVPPPSGGDGRNMPRERENSNQPDRQNAPNPPRYERPAPETRPAPAPSNERPAPEQRTTPAPRYERPAPESRPAPAPSNERPAPEQRPAPRESNQDSRPASDSRPRDYSSSFRSDSGGAWTRTETRSMQAPEIGRSRIDSAPRQSFQSFGGERNSAIRVNPSPFSGRTDGGAGRADGNRQSAPRQDSQNGGARGRR
jgi:hypothetical protein